MTELRDGFLYHPDGGSPTAQLKRLLANEHNLALDDLFSTTQDEVDDAVLEAEAEHAKVVKRLRRLEAKIAELKEQKAEVACAIKHFEKTGELSEILYPACDRLLAAARQEFAANDSTTRANEIADAKNTVCELLGPDWDVDGASADDEFVYLTVKRRRLKQPNTPRPTRDKLIEMVKQAFDSHALTFMERVKPVRLASITSGRPRAP